MKLSGRMRQALALAEAGDICSRDIPQVTLDALVRRGLVRCAGWHEQRRQYRLTPAGRETVAATRRRPKRRCATCNKRLPAGSRSSRRYCGRRCQPSYRAQCADSSTRYSRYPGDEHLLEHGAGTALERIAKRSTQGEDGCRIWIGSLKAQRYPTPQISLRSGGLCFRASVPALLWVLHHGKARDGCEIRRACGNCRCVAIDHLVAMTPKESGEHLARVGQGNRRLTAEQVVLIRARRDSGQSIYHLAAEWGVSVAAVYRVAWGKTYRDVPEAA